LHFATIKELKMNKVLVTGATGFIGGHIVDSCIKRGDLVRALVLENDPFKFELKSKDVEIFHGDMRDYSSVEKACSGIDIVFHCAAVATDWAPKEMFEDVTIGGMENICKAALKAKVKRFIDISTSDVFGNREDVVMDERLPLSFWGEPYPDSKIRAEEIAWRYHKEKGLPVAMVYPLWVYGPGDKTFVPLLADAIVKKDMIFWAKGAIVWPTYIENLMDLLMLISIDDRAIGNGYLVHDGESTTLEEFCAEIAKTLGVPEIKTRIPYFAAYATAVIMETAWRLLKIKTRPLLTTYAVKNLGSKFRFSMAKVERELNWKPKISYANGFAKTMEWLKTLDMSKLKQK
jgi:nucleoside-diphosphate-sugar epimerase